MFSSQTITSHSMLYKMFVSRSVGDMGSKAKSPSNAILPVPRPLTISIFLTSALRTESNSTFILHVSCQYRCTALPCVSVMPPATVFGDFASHTYTSLGRRMGPSSALTPISHGSRPSPKAGVLQSLHMQSLTQREHQQRWCHTRCTVRPSRERLLSSPFAGISGNQTYLSPSYRAAGCSRISFWSSIGCAGGGQGDWGPAECSEVGMTSTCRNSQGA